ncbi:MAG TPA: DUF1269 domain-containing protein [Solirubrobacteraceae bacterium]|nr:DUF1269 domain-containing protein [Solirubrobacteraceae bacterium]
MALESIVVSFDGDNAASVRYAEARDRAGRDARWSQDVGLVEHHHSGRLLLRGMFAGHYLDVDESDHVSQRGAGEGAIAGGLIGVLGGPPGIAVGLLVGGVVGSQAGTPSEVESEPLELAERLRSAIPRGCSAIVLIAQGAEIDEMLAALGASARTPSRQPVSDAQAAALEASLGADASL